MSSHTPGRTFRFHAACIKAARANNPIGICRDCWHEASTVTGHGYVEAFIACYDPDGSIDLAQCLDDGAVPD